MDRYRLRRDYVVKNIVPNSLTKERGGPVGGARPDPGLRRREWRDDVNRGDHEPVA